MTVPKRAAYKARTSVRVVDKDLKRAEVRFPDGTIVQAWLVAGSVKIVEGGPVNREEEEILAEKVRDTFPEQEQKRLFG